jgi:hypothetical protein
MEGLPSLAQLIRWSGPRSPRVKEGMGLIRRYYTRYSSVRPSLIDATTIYESIYEEDDLENITAANPSVTLDILREAWLFSPRNFRAKSFFFVFKIPYVPDRRAKKKLRFPLSAGDNCQVITMQVKYLNFIENSFLYFWVVL